MISLTHHSSFVFSLRTNASCTRRFSGQGGKKLGPSRAQRHIRKTYTVLHVKCVTKRKVYGFAMHMQCIQQTPGSLRKSCLRASLQKLYQKRSVGRAQQTHVRASMHEEKISFQASPYYRSGNPPQMSGVSVSIQSFGQARLQELDAARVFEILIGYEMHSMAFRAEAQLGWALPVVHLRLEARHIAEGCEHVRHQHSPEISHNLILHRQKRVQRIPVRAKQVKKRERARRCCKCPTAQLK